MKTSAEQLSHVGAMLERRIGAVPYGLRLELRPLRGGLESAGVLRVSARYRDAGDRARVFTFVAKRVAGAAAREGPVYENLVAAHAAELAPELLGSQRTGDGELVLYLEALHPTSSWPWRESRAAREVLGGTARLHQVLPGADAMAALVAWDYDEELRQSAECTLGQLEQVRGLPEYGRLRASFRAVDRVVAALPAIRRQLLRFGPLGTTAIHGDLHPGNAVLRRRHRREEAVLLDWGRARIGSPLEDVSSWLQSLAGWEPEARRRHDTLFTGYLSARGMDQHLGSDLRGAYWLAGASNALSGALLHHLRIVADERVTRARRGRAAHSALEWLRVLRRADTLWR